MSEIFESPINRCKAEGRNISVINCSCPSCGNEMVMFTDETKVKCPNCGREISAEECRENQIEK